MRNILGDVIINPDLRRYYLQHFCSAISGAGGAQFAMSYFFLYGGASVSDVILTMVIYGISALSAIYPVAWLVNKIGVRKTHSLHLIPYVATLCIVLAMIFRTQIEEPVGWLLFVWMVVHGWKVMLKRISLTAYFSHHGKVETRGRDVAFAQALMSVAAIFSPLLFGTLIDDGYIIAFVLISFSLSLVGSFCFGLKKDESIKIDLHFKHLPQVMPKHITKALFLPKFVAPFMDDLFFIWILLLFGNSYTLVGGLYAVKLALDLLLSWWVGQVTDKSNIRPFYVAAISITALFWFMVPFISSELFSSALPDGVEVVWVFIGLQFTLGLATLVWDGPYESWYHNAAKESDEALAFSLWREIVIQASMVVGGLFCLCLVQLTSEWHWFIMLGAPATLARLWMMPRKETKL